MTALYTPKEAERWKKRTKRSLAAQGCLLAAGLGACVCLCARVNTLNAHRMLLTVIAVSTLSGWAAILLRRLVWAPARAEAAHTAGLENETTETYRGVLSAPGDVFFIPHGITACRVRLEGGEDVPVLSVDARRIPLLPPAGTPVRVETARKFIVAWEAWDEKD